ncbi:hypothetical protein D3C80_2080820 [compost metagenome]
MFPIGSNGAEKPVALHVILLDVKDTLFNCRFIKVYLACGDGTHSGGQNPGP